jgi:hypothetical protein
MPEKVPQNRGGRIQNLVRRAVSEADIDHASPLNIRIKISNLNQLLELANKHLQPAQLHDVHTQLDRARTLLRGQLEQDPLEAAWRIAGLLFDIEHRAMHPDLNQILNVKEARADLHQAEGKLVHLRLTRDANVSIFCGILIGRLKDLKVQLNELARDQRRQTRDLPRATQDVGQGEEKGFVRRWLKRTGRRN